MVEGIGKEAGEVEWVEADERGDGVEGVVDEIDDGVNVDTNGGDGIAKGGYDCVVTARRVVNACRAVSYIVFEVQR